MRIRIASTLVAVIAMAAATLAAGVVKTQGVVGNVEIFAGSKTTGKGFMVTVCGYHDADTGQYLGQTQTFGTAFDNEEELFAFCASTIPEAQ